MKPTSKLRFVERKDGSSVYKVLQQWWAREPVGSYHPDMGEWRDVPLVKEGV